MILSIGWQCLREEHSTNTKYHSSYTSPAQVFDPNWTPRIIEVPNGPQSSLIAVLKMPSNPSFPILRIIQLGFVWKSVILPNYQNSSFFWKKNNKPRAPQNLPSPAVASPRFWGHHVASLKVRASWSFSQHTSRHLRRNCWVVGLQHVSTPNVLPLWNNAQGYPIRTFFNLRLLHLK